MSQHEIGEHSPLQKPTQTSQQPYTLTQPRVLREDPTATVRQPQQQQPTVKPVARPSPTELRRQETKQFGSDVSSLTQGVRGSLTSDIMGYASVARRMQRDLPGSPRGALPKAEALEFAAGAISAPESLVNPNVPSVFQLSGKSQAFIAGRIYGEAVTAYVAGKILKPIADPIGQEMSRAFSKVTSPIAERIMTKWRETGELSRFDKFILGRLKPNLAIQTVSEPIMERVSLQGLEAEDVAFDIALSPKSSLFSVSKEPTGSLAKEWAMEHAFKTVYGGLAYSQVMDELGSVSKSNMPFVPEVPERMVSRTIPPILKYGIGIIALESIIGSVRGVSGTAMFPSSIVSPMESVESIAVPMVSAKIAMRQMQALNSPEPTLLRQVSEYQHQARPSTRQKLPTLETETNKRLAKRPHTYRGRGLSKYDLLYPLQTEHKVMKMIAK